MTGLLLAIVFLVVLLAIWQTVQLQQIRRKVDAVPQDGNVFEALGRIGATANDASARARQLESRMNEVERRLPHAVNRTGVIAYNAFGNVTGQLSRSIALLNDAADGIVLTVMVSREETLFFVKEVRGGQGSEQLSPEEAAAVDRAMAL